MSHPLVKHLTANPTNHTTSLIPPRAEILTVEVGRLDSEVATLTGQVAALAAQLAAARPAAEDIARAHLALGTVESACDALDGAVAALRRALVALTLDARPDTKLDAGQSRPGGTPCPS